MRSAKLKVLIVANDRGVLRQLTWLVEKFGYEPLPCADVETALGSMLAVMPEFLVVDSSVTREGRLEKLRGAWKNAGVPYVYTLLVYDDSPLDVQEAIQSGVDDFLRKPIDCGEVLARLRAGARCLEFERRCDLQQRTDPLTGLWSRGRLYEHLHRVASDERQRQRMLACVLLDLDLFRRVNFTYGYAAGNQVLREVADTVRGLCGPGSLPVRLEEDRFCVLLPDHSAEKATKWAERLRVELAEMQHQVGVHSMRVTASFGVVTMSDHSQSAEEVLSRAGEALRLAKESGRNCLVRHGEIREEQNAWKDRLEHGNPFDGTRVRDVMTPFTRWLAPDATLSDAAAKFDESCLDVLPVVDGEGKLAGLLYREALISTSGAGSLGKDATAVGERMRTDCARLPEDADFAEIMERFAGSEETLVAVVRDDAPRGYISVEQFAALMHPVTRETFASAYDYQDGTKFLVVPNEVSRQAEDVAMGV